MSITREKPATIRDVARISGVSVGTVSRSLNAPDLVRPETLAKVRAAISALDFRPDSRAQNMRRKSTLTVGFIVDDIANPAARRDRSRRPMRRCASTAFRSIWSTPTGARRQEAEAIEMLQRGRVDGLVLTINNERDPLTLKRLRDRCASPASCSTATCRSSSTRCCTNHAAGMAQATEYLIGLGHRRIALITGGMEIRPGRERVRGFTETLQNAGRAGAA